ncbi:Crp/Fnr family transcriptional regulator [Halovulum sp. GXIMD14793]
MGQSERRDIHNSDIPLVCRSCEARNRGVCGALTPPQLSELARHTQQRKLSSEEVLSAEGEDSANYGNIVSGVVRLSKLMADGRQQIVGLQFAPDFIGRPFQRGNNVTAEAATDLRVCAFPKTVLDRLIAETPELEHRLHEQALRELDEARDWMLTLGRKTAAEKVASFLHLIAIHFDPEAEDQGKPIRFELPLKRADIADFLGLTIETVSRQITRLRRDGIISVENNRTVSVPDLSRLHEACEAQF